MILKFQKAFKLSFSDNGATFLVNCTSETMTIHETFIKEKRTYNKLNLKNKKGVSYVMDLHAKQTEFNKRT